MQERGTEPTEGVKLSGIRFIGQKLQMDRISGDTCFGTGAEGASDAQAF